MDIKKSINEIINYLKGSNTRLVAVSKTKPVSVIMEAYDAGHRVFGENKVQELTEKADQLPKDIEWHMIGHLQRNKVKYMASFVTLIHAIDSFKLLKEVNKQAKNHNRVIECLLQIHIAEEDTKFGLDENEAMDLLKSDELKTLENVKIVGLMGMATFTENENQIRSEFKHLKNIFDRAKSTNSKNVEIKELSMGMSGDYKIAMEEGSTLIRVGSSIFGERNY
ncbi:MAG TPA: YggS family pyridoxal phosphate-dependent enzyme [Fulvivirga sp.]|nr:YggS family pyridoxal phosphate-dependent enzyme [Fulvivirga sp.]